MFYPEIPKTLLLISNLCLFDLFFRIPQFIFNSFCIYLSEFLLNKFLIKGAINRLIKNLFKLSLVVFDL